MAKNIIKGSFLEQEDCSVIVFLDTSTYLSGVTNPILRIFPPNWDQYVNVEYNLEAITLITPETIMHNSLPSGVYRIIQSVCPNDLAYKEYNYLQVCLELKCLGEIVCEYPDDEDVLNEVFKLKMQLWAAQQLVANCDVCKGTELFNTTVKQIKKLKDVC